MTAAGMKSMWWLGPAQRRPGAGRGEGPEAHRPAGGAFHLHVPPGGFHAAGPPPQPQQSQQTWALHLHLRLPLLGSLLSPESAECIGRSPSGSTCPRARSLPA